MLIKTKNGWKEWSELTDVITAGSSHIPPSEGRIIHFMDAVKRGDQTRIDFITGKFRKTPAQLKREDEAHTRQVFLSLHKHAFPAGFHAKNSMCEQSKEPQGCPFTWSVKYLAGY